jgi:hypothetical protein
MYHTYNGSETALVVNQKGTGKILELQDFSVPVLSVLDGGNIGIGTIYPQSLLHVTGKVDLHQVGAGGGENRFKGLEEPTTANGRAQLVLSSSYSDLVIASSQANSSYGSTLTFAAYDPGNSADYRKFVIQQRGWGGAQFMDFGYTNTATTNPHTVVGNGRLLTLDGGNQRVGIGITNPQATLHVNGSFYSPGCVVQVKYLNHETTTVTVISGNSSFVQTPISLSITPKFSTSIIIVQAFVQLQVVSGGTGNGAYITLRRDDVALSAGNYPQGSCLFFMNGTDNINLLFPYTRTFLATNTNSTTFTVYISGFSTTSSVRVNSTGISQMYVTEIAV